MFLATLPLVFLEVQQNAGALAGGPEGLYTAALTVSLPWTWSLLTGLWSSAVALFYLPGYQCTELGYFETAKRTSGVGAGAAPRQEDRWTSGPDDLGGY